MGENGVSGIGWERITMEGVRTKYLDMMRTELGGDESWDKVRMECVTIEYWIG